jgi:hypothetical protein
MSCADYVPGKWSYSDTGGRNCSDRSRREAPEAVSSGTAIPDSGRSWLGETLRVCRTGILEECLDQALNRLLGALDARHPALAVCSALY